MKSFRPMLRLHLIEWIPVLLGVLIGVATVVYVDHSTVNASGENLSDPLATEGLVHLLGTMQIVTTGLLLFGFGCWIWRLVRYMRSEEP
ncbi:MAG TPA: hypothetical protein VGH90_05875 [Chthoniobacteraceae bacterium]|jgi:hypothetical protein